MPAFSQSSHLAGEEPSSDSTFPDFLMDFAMIAAVTPTNGVKQTEVTKKINPDRPFLAAIIHAMIAKIAQIATHTQLFMLLPPDDQI